MQRRRDFTVQPDIHLGDAELLERLVEGDVAPVDLDSELGFHRGSAMSDDVTEPNSRPPSPARASTRTVGASWSAIACAASRSCRSRASRLRRIASACFCTPEVARNARPRGHEEVAGVAVGDVDDVALLADVLDIRAQDDLHQDSSPSEDRRIVGGDVDAVVTEVTLDAFGCVELGLEHVEYRLVTELFAKRDDACGEDGALDGSRSSPRSPRSPRSRRPFDRCVT